MRTTSILLLISLCLASSLGFAADFVGLQQSMSPDEYKNAGLDKLSAPELAALNAWLQREMQQREAAVAAAPRVDRAGFLEVSDRTVVESRILGEFLGWSGGNRFELENGQVWVQNEAGELNGVKLTDPVVTISPGLMDVWRLKVKGYNTTVKVKRVK